MSRFRLPFLSAGLTLFSLCVFPSLAQSQVLSPGQSTLPVNGTAQQGGQQPANLRQQVQTEPRPLRLNLNAAHRKFVGDVLDYWEKRSDKVERYRCEFKRYVYDPVFGPKAADQAKTYSTGVINYAQPDKGLFEVKSVLHYQPPAKQGEQPQYVARGTAGVEKWICDGKSIFEFNDAKKQLIERQLPPDMQGTSIANGPLPFLFNASRAEIEHRYEIQAITPKAQAETEYWLEALPRWADDAASFQKVHIIIDRELFLPKAIILFDPNYHPTTNPGRTVYVFENREVNWSEGLNALNIFHRQFYEPSTPSGWKKVVEKIGAPQSAGESQTARQPSGPTR